MQPSWGLWPTALVFGVLHVPPTRRFLPWTLTAGVMGLALGAWFFGVLAGVVGRMTGVSEALLTAIARLLADETDLHFVQISAIFSGVPELRKVFDAAKMRPGRGRDAAETRSRRGRDARPRWQPTWQPTWQR